MAGEKDGGTGWMYNQNNDLDKEDYLLGKKIGKNFEQEGTMGQLNAVEYDCAPPSIFASRAEHQVDLHRKLVEDPLVALKKREMEDRKRLLDNPMKMKALQEHIETLKEKKKQKKKKKKKKKHRGSDSEEDSDTDLDLKLLQKLQKMEGREVEEDRRRFAAEEEKERKQMSKKNQYTDVEPDSPTRDARRPPPSVRHNRGTDFSERRNRNDFSERRNRDDFSERRNRDNFSERRDYRRRSPSPRSSPRRRRSRSPRRRSPSPDRRRRHDSDSPRRKSPDRRGGGGGYRRSPDNRRQNASPKRDRKKSPPAKKAMDEEEKARKLAEMMENASWRDEQRSKKVQAYRDQELKEQEDIKREHDSGFMQRELKKAAATSSVESRIKSNKHNIQRGVGVMDKNFARR